MPTPRLHVEVEGNGHRLFAPTEMIKIYGDGPAVQTVPGVVAMGT